MTEFTRDGDELVLTLTAFQKAESAHGNIRVPVSTVREVEALNDMSDLVHGLKLPGSRWPGSWAVGRIIGPIETKTFGTTFAVIHHDAPRGLRVQLDGAAFDQLLIGLENPEAVKRQLGDLQ
jgi:hypothetical protein